MATKLLDRLLKSPIGRRLEAELEAEEALAVADERRATLAELNRLAVEAAQTMPELARLESEARAECERARLAFQEAEIRYQDAARRNVGRHMAFGNQIDRQRSLLRDSRPAAIGEYLDELAAIEESLRAESAMDDFDAFAIRDGLYGERERAAAEHRKVVDRRKARRELVREQRAVVESLTYVDLDAEQLESRIATLRRQLADV